MKRTLAFLLALCMVFTMLPMTAHAEETVVAEGTWGDNITWVLTEDGTLTISGEGTVARTDSNTEYPWYPYIGLIKKVIMEDGITNVPEYAFYTYANLESVILGKDVKTLEPWAFKACEKLTGILLPEGLETIGHNCFARSGLTEIRIPESVRLIDYSAFDSTQLTSVVIPGGVTLGDGVFFMCFQLKTVEIQEGVQVLSLELFGRCDALETIYLPGSITLIDLGVFQRSLTTLYFTGDALTCLKDWMFVDMTLTAYYPAGNETWTEEVMQNYGGTITWVPYEAEEPLPCDNGHHVPGTRGAAKTETGFCAYCDAICHTNGTTIWAIESDGDMIIYGTGENGAGELDYYDYSWSKHRDKIKTLTVEDGVTGNIYDFAECANLKTVYLSKDITEISKFAFALCSNLEQVNIPAGLTYLGSGAFQECAKLTEIVLPATVSEIGNAVFGGCTSLETLRVDENNPYYFTDEQGVLYNMDGSHLLAAPASLTGHYTVPETVVSIYGGVFWGCAKLTEVTISEGVQMLDAYVFKDCTALKTVTFPDGLMELGFYTFENCTALETVIFEGDAPYWFDSEFFRGITATVYYPAGNETWTEEVMQNYGGNITWVANEVEINEIASGWSGATRWTLTSDGLLRFYGEGNMKNYGYEGGQPWVQYADQIKRIVVEEGVTAVGTGAFMNLPKLKYVTLPEKGLKKIGEAAFYGCTELLEINIPEGIYTIWAYTFKNCSHLSITEFPGTLIKIDQGAFENSGAHNVTFPENLNILGAWSFKGCTGLLRVDLSQTKLTKIREGAFKNCRELVTVVLPRDIQILGDSCFYGVALREFTIPGTVTSVEPWCFARARYLKEIRFLGDAPTIGEGAFNKITLNVYYPAGNATWTENIMLNYGGTVTWKAN